MHFQQAFRAALERPVGTALIGCGAFGRSFLSQAVRSGGICVLAAVDRDVDRVVAQCRADGLSARAITTPADFNDAIAAGEIAVTSEPDLILTGPTEMIVEATGDAEFGARVAAAAIAAGIGVTMATKEAECVVGPLLARRARAAGVPYTLVHGDQPALLIALVTWCRLLGLPVVCAGKSSEYDYVWDQANGTVTWTTLSGGDVNVCEAWPLSMPVDAALERRARALSAFPMRTVADFCEMALVANATGLLPDRPDFHAPLTRAIELPLIYRPRDHGGILLEAGRLDVFNCFRRSDETSFAGGVFAVVEWADAASGELFAGKGIPTTTDGRYGLVYNPSHLLGVEAPLSVMAAARLGNTLVDDDYRPRVDMTAVAEADLRAGTELVISGDRHVVPDLAARLTPARRVAGADAPLPYYMAVGRTLVRDVAAGSTLTLADVACPSGSTLWRLRAEQDDAFALETN